MNEPTHLKRQDGPIRSVKDFIKRYFPNAEECPHCNGTGMKHGSDTSLIRRPPSQGSSR